MICADTSIWIAAFGNGKGVEASHLADLLDADLIILPTPIRVELLAGAPRKDHRQLRERLAAVPPAVPDQATWRRIEGWVTTAVEAGERFAMADLLIAATAVDRGAAIWSLDGDFARMERLGFVQRYPAG